MAGKGWDPADSSFWSQTIPASDNALYLIRLAMRNVYVIAYDVADSKRLRKIFQLMKGAGTALQYSVFRCELSPLEKQALKEQLWDLLNFAEDRVILANLGPIEGRGDDALELWGAPRETDHPRNSVII